MERTAGARRWWLDLDQEVHMRAPLLQLARAPLRRGKRGAWRGRMAWPGRAMGLANARAWHVHVYVYIRVCSSQDPITLEPLSELPCPPFELLHGTACAACDRWRRAMMISEDDVTMQHGRRPVCPAHATCALMVTCRRPQQILRQPLKWWRAAQEVSTRLDTSSMDRCAVQEHKMYRPLHPAAGVWREMMASAARW
jgi:hypothetical protein